MKYSKPFLHRVRYSAFRALGTAVAMLLFPSGSDFAHSLAAPPAHSSGAEVAISAAAAQSAAEKVRQIQEASNGRTGGVLAEFSEEEVDSYLAYEMASDYPAGVSKVQVRFLPARILGTSEVDFDKAKAARRIPSGIADYLFGGVHTLSVEGGFSAIDGVGQFDLESVALDGFVLPQMLVNLLIETFLKPRFPDLALEDPFLLPYSIDRVQVMRERIVVEVNPPTAY